jgi:hypothetical protein
MWHHSVVFGLFFIASLSMSAAGVKAEDAVWVAGPGEFQCRQWADPKNIRQRLSINFWLLGFVSGSNFRSAGTGSQAKITDNSSAIAFADKYCDVYPEHTMAQVALAMVENFGGPKAKHPWKL